MDMWLHKGPFNSNGLFIYVECYHAVQTVKQNDWIDEMLATGIRGKGGQKIEFTRIETIGGTRYVHAEAETKDRQKEI